MQQPAALTFTLSREPKAGRGRPAPASTAASKELLREKLIHQNVSQSGVTHHNKNTRSVGPSIGTTDGRHTGDASHRLRNRHRDASLEFSPETTRVCVFVQGYGDGIDDGGDRVGSVLLLLPCHTVTRNDQVARVREWRFSAAAAVPKPGKSLLSSVCVCECVTDYYRARKVCRTRRFSVFPCRV